MILGFSGQAGSGKDTAADLLVEHGAVKVALADPMKRIVRNVYDFTTTQLWGPSAERNKPDLRYPRQHTWVGATCMCCGAPGIAGYENMCYLTARYALQQLGTEYGRGCYVDTWVALCIRTAQRILATDRQRYSSERGLYHPYGDPYGDVGKPITMVVVPDVRFKNEMLAIRAAGGRLVRVKRPGAGLSGSSGQHVSEQEQTGIADQAFDHVIDNSGTLEDLRAKIKGIGVR